MSCPSEKFKNDYRVSLNNSNRIFDRGEARESNFEKYIKPWMEKAKDENKRYIERFIYLWVAFNSWMNQTFFIKRTDIPDSDLMRAASADDKFSNRFEKLIDEDDEFKKVTKEFHSLWPIFDAREVVQKGIGPWEVERLKNREKYRKICFEKGVERYNPFCFLEEQVSNQKYDHNEVPLDWEHTISAIYRIRCNLFHGGKSFTLNADKKFAEYSFTILWKIFIKEKIS